jgi:hypothetical protein
MRPSVSDSRRAWELREALPEQVKALDEKRLQSKAPRGGFVTFFPSLTRCQLVSNDDVDVLYREVADGVRTNGSSCKAQSPDDALAAGSDRFGLMCRRGDPMVNDRSSRRTNETIGVLDRHVQDGRDRQDGRVKASRTGRVERTRSSNDASLHAGRTIAVWLVCHRKAHWSNRQESNVQTKKKAEWTSIGARSDLRSYHTICLAYSSLHVVTLRRLARVVQEPAGGLRVAAGQMLSKSPEQ